MQIVKVIGAGFSGLVTAYYLVKEGFKVQIVEKKSRAGGLIQTLQTPHGPVETAASGIRNSVRVEAMCADVGVRLQPTRREARARYIFRGRPTRFPLGGSEVLKIGFRFASSATSLKPMPMETIGADVLLAPAPLIISWRRRSVESMPEIPTGSARV